MTEREIIHTMLHAVHPLNEDEFEAFVAALKPVEYGRKEVITEAGKVQHNMLIVLEGVQYSYFINEGKLHVVAFTYPVQVTGVPDSFFTQSPSYCFLETVTPTYALALSYEDLQRLYDRFPNIERLNRKMLEGLLTGTIKRHYELLSTSAEERFRAFAARSPHLFQLVPHKLIASYLRIDATNFSKFYNEIRI